MLEKTAIDYNFAEEKMVLILRSTLTDGRAKDVVLALRDEEKNDYEAIKMKVLRAFESRPEKYR